MKQTIRLTESSLHKIIQESVKRVLKEGFNQFSDSDFASEGNPYGLDNELEEESNLDGWYGSFNNIDVWISGDGTDNPRVKVEGFYNGNIKRFEGEEAKKILDVIKEKIKEYGNTNTALYQVLYKFVL